MIKIYQTINQLNSRVEEYKLAIVRLQRNRDFLIYIFRRKSVSKKFQGVNEIIVALRNEKDDFDREHHEIRGTATITSVVRQWLASYELYLQKVLEHVAIVEQLQPLYEKSWREKIEEGQKIQQLLNQLSRVVEECQVYADRANEWGRQVN